LPNIIDESGYNAKIFRIQSVPSNTFSTYQISNRATGNSIIFSPPSGSNNITYLFLVMILDDAPVQKISTYSLTLTIFGVDVKKKANTNYNPFGDGV